jgi:hypothetical protein
MFRQVDNVCWDMMTGRVGFRNSDGICSIELGNLNDEKTEAVDAQVSINPFDDFGMTVPAFAQSVAVESINLGDMIFSSSSNKVLGWVVKKNEKSFKLMKQDGTRSDWVPPKVQMLGFDSGVMVLRSLMNMLPGGQSQLGQMQNMLMPMMAMGMMGGEDGGEDMMSSMMPMMLFSQMNGGGTDAATSMAPMMQMMMMQKMFSGMGNQRTSGTSKKTDSTTSFFDKR